MGALLNAQITLQQFNSGFTYRNRVLAQAFVGGVARQQRLLPAGTILWKCTQFPLPNNPTELITEWWCSSEHLDATLQRCKNLRVSLRRYARARLAVIWEWSNSMDNLLRARLLQPVYGFVGPAKWQNTQFSIDEQYTKLPANRLTLIGGDTQYCIPNLTSAHVTQMSSTSADQLPAGWQTFRSYRGGRAG